MASEMAVSVVEVYSWLRRHLVAELDREKFALREVDASMPSRRWPILAVSYKILKADQFDAS